MEIFEFKVAEDSNSWKSEPNFERFGYDLTNYTEGVISFSDSKSKIFLNTFLLEFVIEVDLMLRRRCGLDNFDTYVSLQISGDSIIFKRTKDLLFLQISGLKEVIEYDWNDFIESFMAMKKLVYSKFKGCYPKISKFKEIELLFLC
jgi:hypothetical protein